MELEKEFTDYLNEHEGMRDDLFGLTNDIVQFVKRYGYIKDGVNMSFLISGMIRQSVQIALMRELEEDTN